ncbi:MAG: stage III sporulation protein AF [Ruminococcus sp.]|nr:stage III sporulation protein AF [Ruminococcus sp.]
MESLKMVVLSASALSLMIGMVQAIKPSGKYDRQLRLFTAGLMLLGVLAPLLEGVQEISPDWEDASAAAEQAQELEEESEEQMLLLAQEEVAQVLQQELAQQAVPCSRLSVEMHIEETGRISISSVSVVSTKPEEAEAAIRQYFGKDVEIHAGSHS